LDWLDKIKNITSLDDLENIRIEIFGKKGFLPSEFKKLQLLSQEDKISRSKFLNSLKSTASDLIQQKKIDISFKLQEKNFANDKIDVSRFDTRSEIGSLHPVVTTMNKIIDYFMAMNFSLETGPLIEDDFYNFGALNLPLHHPARDMQDTFYFKDSTLLRTHTSPVQIRTMLNQKPPIKIISHGPVFRKDYDLTHTPMFHQVEGLVVDNNSEISFANLKYILEDFLIYMFGDIEIRMRSSFFPFTEPSAEVDINCIFCNGGGCKTCSNTGWLEVLGCGMVDENVFHNVGYSNVSGYAFGLGVERFAMLTNGISDLRMLFENDLRLLEQFK
jgi:phenylalanyl-tRNA synthetase alpha chain